MPRTRWTPCTWRRFCKGGTHEIGSIARNQIVSGKKTYGPGSVVDYSEDEAGRLIRLGVVKALVENDYKKPPDPPPPPQKKPGAKE
ncbi:MAG: hypothetical protein LBK08_10375 [Treponema sp.]|jgi:hypothetical protein|nr:hypothetical protein [Treponema sp.]